MSDTPIEDWWQAKDGRWYPPETHPSVAGGPVAPPAGWARRPDGTWGPTPPRTDTPPPRPADIESTMSSAATEAPKPGVSFGHLAEQAFRPAPIAGPGKPSGPTATGVPTPDREVTVVHVERRRPSPRALVAFAVVLIVVLAGAGWLAQRDDGTTPVIDDADRVATTSRPARGTTSTTTYATTTAMAVTSAPSVPLVPESTAVAPTSTTSTTASGSRRRTTTTVKSSPATVPKSTPTAAPPATPTPTDPPATTPPTTAPPATTAAPTTSPTTTSPEPTIPDP